MHHKDISEVPNRPMRLRKRIHQESKLPSGTARKTDQSHHWEEVSGTRGGHLGEDSSPTTTARLLGRDRNIVSLSSKTTTQAYQHSQRHEYHYTARSKHASARAHTHTNTQKQIHNQLNKHTNLFTGNTMRNGNFVADGEVSCNKRDLQPSIVKPSCRREYARGSACGATEGVELIGSMA